jgi:hypothetical protein
MLAAKFLLPCSFMSVMNGRYTEMNEEGIKGPWGEIGTFFTVPRRKVSLEKLYF